METPACLGESWSHGFIPPPTQFLSSILIATGPYLADICRFARHAFSLLRLKKTQQRCLYLNPVLLKTGTLVPPIQRRSVQCRNKRDCGGEKNIAVCCSLLFMTHLNLRMTLSGAWQQRGGLRKARLVRAPAVLSLVIAPQSCCVVLLHFSKLAYFSLRSYNTVDLHNTVS